MCNKTLKRFRVTTVAIVKHEYYIGLVCVCSLIYPGCKAHVPYYTAFCGLFASTLLCHKCHKGNGFRKKAITHKMCFDFSLQLLSETFLILRIQRDNIINAYKLLCKVPVIFEKSSNVNIHECPSSGGRVVPRMDGQTDVMKLIIALHNLRKCQKYEKSTQEISVWRLGCSC